MKPVAIQILNFTPIVFTVFVLNILWSHRWTWRLEVMYLNTLNIQFFGDKP